MPAPELSLYDQVVHVTYIYLGPAADRFVTRQITNHLQIKPEQLKEKQLSELIDWIRLAMGFLTEDERMITKYIDRLQQLNHNGSSRLKADKYAIETR